MRTNYGWVVVAVGALMTCVAVGAMFSLAVFLQPITEATGWSRAGVSSAMTLNFLTMGLAGFGWGTNLTNDFVGCPPGDPDAMRALSLVCKVKDANGRPAVKLSDNYRKAVGPPDEVERYRRVFGIEGLTDIPVVV